MKQTLWTIQHIDAYENMKKTGVLHANEQFLFCQDDMRYAYDWIAQQMCTRIGAPPADVEYPVWAWYQWEGKRKRRDLRHAGYAKRGTPMVQIEFEAEETTILLSDFDDWHLVLGNHYIADNEADLDRFYLPGSEESQGEICASWEKVFDLDRYTPNWDCPPERQSIQACVWEVHMSQVKKVEFFTAK